MTFSLIGRCEETGSYGAAITTSNLAVGSRCVRLAHGKGATLSQHRTDSRLGDLGISLLENGASANDAVTRMCASTDNIDWRQIGALDADGKAAFYHGRKMYSIYSHSIGKNCLALGNILDNDKVTDRMIEVFQDQPDLPLSERLMRALEAGRDAGGEVLGPLKSAALRVSGDNGIDMYDLRVDISQEDPVQDLRLLYEAYSDSGTAFRMSALTPDNLPVMRNLFDASIQRIAELGLETQFPTKRDAGHWTLRD